MNNDLLTDEEKRALLKAARDSIREYLKLSSENFNIIEEGGRGLERGAFVTLHKNGNLRGCIGFIYPQGSLLSSVKRLAVEAAVHDPRFNPVSEDELKEIDIEISVLTLPKRVSKPEDIIMGKDGVIIKKGFRQGVFLPQVADETGWSLEEFLSNLASSKAGLAEDSWREPSTELYVFQAVVFGEKEMGIL